MMDPREAQTRWAEYARTRAPRLREQLISDYAICARRAVERLQITAWGCVSREDLLGHAVLGLIDAVDRYNPEYGVSFEAFAMPRIRGAVLDGLRNLDWAPRSVRGAESRLRRAYARLEGRLGRAPGDEELAEELGISPVELEQIISEVSRTSVSSLDDLVAGMSDTTRRGELVPDGDRHDPYRSEERGEAKRRLVEALQALPEREKLVVSLYYYEELTLREIGRVLGVTEQRVSQIHTRAMMKLSHRLIRHTELVAALVP